MSLEFSSGELTNHALRHWDLGTGSGYKGLDSAIWILGLDTRAQTLAFGYWGSGNRFRQ